MSHPNTPGIRNVGVGLAAAGLVALVACTSSADGRAATSSTAPADVSTSSTAPADHRSAATGSFDDLIDVGGHSLHLVCEGSGEPAVIVEMGAGAQVRDWIGIVDALAHDRRACVYERAGIGESEAGPETLSAQQVADELHTMLTSADLPTPMIVVSHSLGGLDAQALAQRHPDDVAALVFAEPRTAEYQLGYRDNLTDEERAIDGRETKFAIESLPFGPEIAAIDDSAAAVDDAGSLPDVPVIVLSAGVPFPDASEADQAFWLATHQHLAAQVSDGTATVVAGADHDIFRSKRQAILDAVDEISNQI